MPTELPIPAPVVSNRRSCTALLISAPIGGGVTAAASFTRRITRADGTFEDVPDGDVGFTQKELLTVAHAADFKGTFAAAAHAKRNAYDP